MKIIDKNNFLEKINRNDLISIELGCGDRKRIEHAVGIDMLDYECVDIVGEVFNVLKAFPSNSVDEIHSFHFIEHVADLEKIMEEILRILKQSGSIHFVAPHFSNSYFYSDYTHKSFFGLYTFCYFSKNSFFKRSVPTYQKQPLLDLTSVDLIFKSTRPFYFRHGIKKIIGSLFNLTTFTKELYEENFCYLFPCYEISYKMKKVSDEINSPLSGEDI